MQYSKVLLIDDDEDDQEIFLLAMKEIASEVACTVIGSALDALTQLDTLGADLIFLDLNMPLMNGQQFLTELNKKNDLSRIPVIILSTTSSTQVINETTALGAREFITKPRNFADLKTILYKILE